MRLCKYCDKSGINILQHKALKLSHIDDFNDPFEFRLAKSGDDNINQATAALYDYQKKNYRVLCFSADHNNLIMWGHYSKSHTGMLIQFDTKLIAANDRERLSDFIDNVEYEDGMIEIPSNYVELDLSQKENVLRKITYRKYTDWQYEDEYRALVNFDHDENKRYLDIDPKSVIEVVLGMRCDLETELNIRNILHRDEYFHVEFKRAILDDKKYQMKYVKVAP